MFGFLKDKLKKAVQAFTKATETPAPEPAKPEVKAQPETPKAKPTAKPAKTKQAPKAKPQTKQTPAKPEPKQPPKVVAAPEKPVAVAKPEPVAAPIAAEPQQPEPKRSFFDKVLGRNKEPEPAPEHKQEPTRAPEQKPEPETQPKEKTGFFAKLTSAVTTKKISKDEFDAIFSELELELMASNVALAVVDKLKDDLWHALSDERLGRFASVEEKITQTLKESISDLFIEPFDLLTAIKKKTDGPYVICAIGINGSGKTTTLAKLASYLKEHKLEPVVAAGDTFRAAAIQQLEEHTNRIGVHLIKQAYGADAAAVAYDAIQYAKAHAKKVVLIDTAGRLHSNTNLMAEMQKIIRVAKPDVTLFIGEATTGNDCVEQAVTFQAAVPIDGIILSKVDVDERGGAALSISYVTKKPILFFGTGQTYADLEPFDRKKVLANLALT